MKLNSLMVAIGSSVFEDDEDNDDTDEVTDDEDDDSDDKTLI